jgi:hypothetical protein
MTMPEGSKVAVWKYRASDIGAVEVQVPVAGVVELDRTESVLIARASSHQHLAGGEQCRGVESTRLSQRSGGMPVPCHRVEELRTGQALGRNHREASHDENLT